MKTIEKVAIMKGARGGEEGAMVPQNFQATAGNQFLFLQFPSPTAPKIQVSFPKNCHFDKKKNFLVMFGGKNEYLTKKTKEYWRWLLGFDESNWQLSST